MEKITGYKPTTEQLEAAKARREAQQAEKAARKNKAGGKTVKSKDGTYKSVTVTPKQVEAKQKQRILENLKKEQHFGGKTIFDEKTGKYVSQSAKEVKEAAENAAKTTTKKTGLLSKLGKFGKKAGKFGLIGLGVAALVGGGIYVYNKLSGNGSTSEEATPLKENSTPAPADKSDSAEKAEKTPAPAPEEKAEETEKSEKTPAPAPEEKAEESEGSEKTPAPAPEEKAEETEKSKESKESEEAKDVPTEHTVVKGDNVWNIAKQHLIDLKNDPNYKPTDAEILKHTKELMELNNLEFEPDGYHVIIKPQDKLKLVA